MRSRPFTVAVASGKGGVGKSTIALNLAVALAAQGARVGLLDADIYGPDLPRMVNLARHTHARSITLAVNPDVGTSRIEPITEFGIEIASAGFMVAEDQALDWEAPLVELLISQLTGSVGWGPLDHLIVDLPPGTADVQQQITQRLSLDGALVVVTPQDVTPQDVAHLDARRVLVMLRGVGVPVLGGVENMSMLVCPCCGEHVEVFPSVREDRSIWSPDVTRLAAIPLDPQVARSGDTGQPLVLTHPDSAPAVAIRELASMLMRIAS